MRKSTVILVLLLYILTIPSCCYTDLFAVGDCNNLTEITAEIHFDPETNFLYMILDDQTINIIRYTGDDENVDIPDTIQGHVVSCLGDYVFKDVATTNIFLSYSDIHLSELTFADYAGTVWIPGNHPTLDLVAGIIRKDTKTIEYYSRIESQARIKYRRYCIIDEYWED